MKLLTLFVRGNARVIFTEMLSDATIKKLKCIIPSCIAYSRQYDMVVGGYCPYNTKQSYELNASYTSKSSFNEDIACADTNRAGVMCGKCNNSTAISINSFDYRCMNSTSCSYYNLFYVVGAELGTVTLLFAIVIFF